MPYGRVRHFTNFINFQLDNSFVVSNYSRRLHSHKTLVLELAADGYNLTQFFNLLIV